MPRLLPAALLALLPLTAAAQTAEDFPGQTAALLDADGDGIITAEEMTAFSDRIIVAMDANEDGTVDRAEALVALSEAQVAQVDANGDGVIAPDELAAVIAADFSAADLDGSGTLN
jgi:hypothetical protein